MTIFFQHFSTRYNEVFNQHDVNEVFSVELGTGHQEQLIIKPIN